MSYIDLHSTLRTWSYDPDKISVRKILGVDGAVRVQMRVELGILQMEADGRPDGTRPFGADSLVHHHQRRLAEHVDRNGTALGYVLSPRECEALRLEASMYYRRYVALFVLEEFEGVVRDTAHSLQIFDLCRDHALEQPDRAALEEYRPYLLMMHARSLAYQAVRDGKPDSALAHVNRGILNVKAFLSEKGLDDSVDQCEELNILRALGRELGGQMPRDSVLVTRKALRTAIQQERFEEAARLRDELKNLTTRKEASP